MNKTIQERLQASDGVRSFAWKVYAAEPIFNVTMYPPGGGSLGNGGGYQPSRALQLAEDFLAAKERLGYRRKGTGALDMDAILAVARSGKSPLVRIEGHRVILSTHSHPTDEVCSEEALAAVLARPEDALPQLVLYCPTSGEYSYDQLLATLLCVPRAGLQLVELCHDAWYDPDDDYSSSFSYVSVLPELCAKLPDLRRLVVEASFPGVRPLRHPGLVELELKLGATASLEGLLREAELPSLQGLTLDLRDDVGFSQSPWIKDWPRGLISRFDSLRTLTIRHACCGDQIIADLLEGLPPQLVTLELHEVGATDEGRQKLARLGF